MPIHNTEVADILDEVADLLEIDGANEFRVRAYRDAARVVRGLPRSVAQMIDDGDDLTQLRGIGKSLAEKIEEVASTGTLEQLEELHRRLPPALTELLGVSGLGPKRVGTIHEELRIDTLDELAEAAEEGQLQELPGLGEKTESKILEEIERTRRRQRSARHLLIEVEEPVDDLIQSLSTADHVQQITVAGSYRRRKETVGDLDLVAITEDSADLMRRFVGHEDVEEVVSQGETRSSVVLRGGLQVDLRAVGEASAGAALLYLTGSKAHSIRLRKRGQEREIKVNEYGLFSGDEQIAGETEAEMYDGLGLAYIEPELREDRGELEAAEKGELPALVELGDLKGDLHAHTDDSDGADSLASMAEAAVDLGLEYLAITNHSKRLTVANGLDEERLRRLMEAIDELNEQLEGVRLLKGIECDILEDGSLDLDAEVLAELELVVGSIHSKFGLDRTKQTERVLRAMDNPHLNILAHPSGRLLDEREAHELDLERAIDGAVERGCFLEVNSQPDRLDLTDEWCQLARERGLKLAISSDAHRASGLARLRYGVGQARRGWLEAADVINTRSLQDLLKLLRRG